MKENKAAEFWEIEKELREILFLIRSQLELTYQVLSDQLPKLQERFLQFMELGTELGFDMDSLDVEKFCDHIMSNELFQENDSLEDDTGD